MTFLSQSVPKVKQMRCRTQLASRANHCSATILIPASRAAPGREQGHPSGGTGLRLGRPSLDDLHRCDIERAACDAGFGEQRGGPLRVGFGDDQCNLNGRLARDPHASCQTDPIPVLFSVSQVYPNFGFSGIPRARCPAEIETKPKVAGGCGGPRDKPLA